MSIDYEKVEGFKALEQKEAKLQLATYAQETFDVKLNRQKSFENMLAILKLLHTKVNNPFLMLLLM